MSRSQSSPRETQIIDPYPWSNIEGDVELMIVGDINIQNRREPSNAFRHVQHTFSKSDVLFGNLEGCLYHPGRGDIPEKKGWTHSEEHMVSGLTSAGFDAVGCANNVVYGTDAVSNTLDVLAREGIESCGAGDDIMRARRPAIVEKHGTSIGFHQRTARLHHEDAAASQHSPGVAAFDPDSGGDIEEIREDVARLHNKVDFSIFSYHLRETTTTSPADYQRRLAREVIDSGADLVFGHGAHVNQGIDIYDGTPIFHCIGQLVFDWQRALALGPFMDGLVVRGVLSDNMLSTIEFAPVYRDAYNDAYIAHPTSTEGRRQVDQIRELSPEIPIKMNDAVLEIPIGE